MSTQKHGNSSFDVPHGQHLISVTSPSTDTQSKVSLSRPDHSLMSSVRVFRWITCCYTQELDKTGAHVQQMPESFGKRNVMKSASVQWYL